MRNAARGGRRWQQGFSIMRSKSRITRRIMRKKSSRESLDFVKLLDSHLPVNGAETLSGTQPEGCWLNSVACEGACVDAECVYVAVHQLGKSAVDQSMTLNCGLTTKRVSNYKYSEMSFAIARACVTRMQMTVIFNS